MGYGYGDEAVRAAYRFAAGARARALECAFALADAVVGVRATCVYVARLAQCALASGDLRGRLWHVPSSRGPPRPGVPRRGELCVVRVFDRHGEAARLFARGGGGPGDAPDPRDVVDARRANETRVLCATLHVVSSGAAAAAAFDVTAEMYAPLGRFTPRDMASTLAGREALCAVETATVFAYTMEGEFRAETDDDVPSAARAAGVATVGLGGA